MNERDFCDSCGEMCQQGPNGEIITPPNEEIITPPEEPFNDEAFRGSMQQILSDNLGNYASVEFLIGTTIITIKEGILYSVGRSYVVLFDESNRTYIVCDIFSIKFVTFYEPGRRPVRRLNTIATQSNNRQQRR